RRAMTFPIPDSVDEVVAAAAWNPGLSAWMTLTWRARLEAGETVLVLGATGVTGKLAVQTARRLGAGRIVAAGRNPRALDELLDLGATATVRVDQPDDALAAAFAAGAGEDGYGVIVDYLWGRPTEVLLDAIGNDDLELRSSRTRLVQVGRHGRLARLAAGGGAAQRGAGDPGHGHRRHAAHGDDQAVQQGVG